jgi:acyl-CoA synthetase (AMP-forming)/AMP-acid ligase II
MLVHHFLERSAMRHPEKKAVWYNDQWMTYLEINRKADTFAGFLVEQGIKQGHRVALLYENCFDYIISFFGILKAGCVVVALPAETTSNSIYYVVKDCGATALIMSKRMGGIAENVFEKESDLQLIVCDDCSIKSFGTKRVISFEAVISSQYHVSSVRVISIDLAAIVYTSGSTGTPKGVMLTHQNLFDNTNSIVDYLGLTENDRIMVVLPFYYIYGNSLLLTHFCVGGSLVIDNHFTFPNVVLKTMKEQEVTGFAGVPSSYSLLLHKSNVQSTKIESLRYLTQAGGHMAVQVQEEVVKVFAPALLYVMYGATELAPRLTWLPPWRWSEKKGSIGIPVPNVDAFIADEKGDRLPPGEVGQIVGRGSNVMRGYWNDPEGTARVLRNGLYYTGDIGWADEEGYLYVVGRSKDLLKIGGNRVSTREIEDALLHVDIIEEAAVIGIPDPILGEAAKAFVVCKRGGFSDELIVKKALSGILPVHKLPKYIVFCDVLPRNKAGKILKDQL